MKTLYIGLVLVAALGAAMGSIFVLGLNHNNSFAQGETNPANGTSQVSTIIIPKGVHNTSVRITPYEIRVVIGVNNTVRWLNEADREVTIVAGSYDDPGFASAAKLSSASAGASNQTNYILPGHSFEYTFTKGGYFLYRVAESLSMHGVVIVWPQAEALKVTEVLSQPEVLNHNDSLNPCHTFHIPCQNVYNLVAKKLDSGIYIENMTVKGLEYYDIIHPTYSCLYPVAIGTQCFYPDNIQLLESIGAKNIPKFILPVSSAYQGPDTWWWPKTVGCAQHGGETRCVSDSEQILDVVPGVLRQTSEGTLVSLTFFNGGIAPITSLSAVYALGHNYTFNCNVSDTHPLRVGGSITANVTMPSDEPQRMGPFWISGVSNTIPFRFAQYDAEPPLSNTPVMVAKGFEGQPISNSGVNPLSKERSIYTVWGNYTRVHNDADASLLAGYGVKFPTKLPGNYTLQLAVMRPLLLQHKYVYLFYSQSTISDAMKLHEFFHNKGIMIRYDYNSNWMQDPLYGNWASYINGEKGAGYPDAHDMTINGYKGWAGSNHMDNLEGWPVQRPSVIEYDANGVEVQVFGGISLDQLVAVAKSIPY